MHLTNKIIGPGYFGFSRVLSVWGNECLQTTSCLQKKFNGDMHYCTLKNKFNQN